MRILFLDDSPERVKKFRGHWPSAVTVSCAPDAIAMLKTGPWDRVYLDHDLGGEEYVDSSSDNCGMTVVRWIVKHKPNIAEIIIHSLNQPARENMLGILIKAGYTAQTIPFINLFG